MTFLKWIDGFVSLFYPRCCVVCEGFLAEPEKGFCVSCDIHLPRTYLHLLENNPVEKIFWGRTTVEKVASWFYYKKGSDSDRLIHQLKYNQYKELGNILGRNMATELLGSGFFEGIELLVPVPLHPKKHQMRGYNQSHRIACGVASVTRLPVITQALVKIEETGSQLSKGVYQRWENTSNTFEVIRPELFRNRHILLIDDVITTGATLIACCRAVENIPHVKISILTLAATQR